MSWLVWPLRFRKFGGKTIHAASVKKALATSQPIFKLTSSILPSQGWFLWKDDDPGYAAASFQGFKRRQDEKAIRQLSYSPKTATADLFLFQRGEIGAGGPLAVQERPHDEVGWGCPNHQQKRVHRGLLAVDRPLQKVHPNRLWLSQ